MLGNLFVVSKFSDLFEIEVITNYSTIFCIKGSKTIEAKIGQQISIVAAENVERITVTGLKYSLTNEPLSPSSRAISNEAIGENFLLNALIKFFISKPHRLNEYHKNRYHYYYCLLYLFSSTGFFRKPKATISQRDYIIHGRKLSLPGFVISLVSTWYGAILGVGENTYLYGIQTWFIFGLPYYFFAVIYAFWLSKKFGAKIYYLFRMYFEAVMAKTLELSALFLFFII